MGNDLVETRRARRGVDELDCQVNLVKVRCVAGKSSDPLPLPTPTTRQLKTSPTTLMGVRDL